MDTIMEPMLNMMMEAEPTGMVIDTKWAAENFSPADLSNLENVLNANYAFPLAPMNFGGSPDNSLPDTIYQTQGSFPESTSPGSGYGSLEYDGPDSGCSLALEGHSTSKSDAKEKSKERRKAQNRSAQRAYRQRKDQAIRDGEKEIEMLRLQLAREKQLNEALAKLVGFLKERLNGKPSESAFRAAGGPQPGCDITSSQSEISSQDLVFSSYAERTDYFS